MLEGLTFHHVGVATFDLEKTAFFYLQAGYEKSATYEDFIQGVKICFLSRNDSPMIELVSPLQDGSPVSKIIQKSGVIPYHLCYEVADIEQQMSNFRLLKFIPITKPVSAIAFNDRLVCFLFHKNYGLFELLEK